MSGEPKNEKPFTSGRRTQARRARLLIKVPKKTVVSGVSEKGLEFIARWEGCVLRPYNDSVGYATVGVGHLLHYSKVTEADIKKWAGFTYAKAIDLLKEDAARYVAAVNSYHLNLTQPQFDALVSFTFNLGPGCLSQVVPSIKVGNWSVMLAYDHAGGVVVEGLRRRRASEVNLAEHGTYNF